VTRVIFLRRTEQGVRVETSLAPSYGTALAPWPRPVTPVAPAAPPESVLSRAPAYTPERIEAARQMAAQLGLAGSLTDDAGLSHKARRAVHAYTGVRDGDRREYLHRVLGLEERA